MGSDPKTPTGGGSDDESLPAEEPGADQIEGVEGLREEQRSGRPQAALPPIDVLKPQHAAYVRSLIAKLGITPAYEHEDIVQEVLIQAHKSRDSDLEPRALLFGITRHVVYRWILKREHERVAVASQLEDAEDARAPSAEQQWIAAERARAVHEAIEELPPMFREVFVRCELEDMTMPQVARELRIRINTGYTRLHLARGRFAESIKRYMARRRIKKDDLGVPVPPLFLLANDAADGASGAAKGGAAKAASAGWLAHWPIATLGLVSVAVAVAVVLAWPRAPSAVPVAPTAEARPPASDPSSSPSAEPSAPVQPGPASTETGSGEPVDVVSAPSLDDKRADAGAGWDHLRSEGAWARSIVGQAKSGDVDGASKAAEKFRERFPTSTYQAWIDKAIAEGPGGGP
jgi:RNA polymerase sigma factor (sigma-70 family)